MKGHRGRSSPNSRYAKAAGAVVLVVIVSFVAYSLLTGQSDSGVVSSSQVPAGTPILPVVEGQPGYAYPYYPDVLHVPVGRLVVVQLTDNLGGCGLETIFEGLGVHGGNSVANVPVGQTEYVEILAPVAGNYSFHCGANMYYGTVVAAQ